MTAHINIGSNRGDSKALIERAVAAIASRWPECTLRVSTPVVSAPWGFESDRDFINIGVALELPDLDVYGFFDSLMEIQQSICAAPHRNADGTYRDRELDIDLIAVDSFIIDTPRMVLPHPRMHLRPFVLAPLAELAPEWRHPVFHLTPQQILHELEDKKLCFVKKPKLLE